MSSTVERSFAWKKPIEDGSVVVVSTPTIGTLVAVIPRSIDVSRALAVERWTGPIPSGWSRTTITESTGPNSPLAWEKSPPRTTSGSVPPITICRPTPAPSSFISSGSVATSEKRVAESSSARPLVSTGSRTTPTPTSFAPVGPSASSTAEVISLGRLPKAISAIRCPCSRSRVSTGYTFSSNSLALPSSPLRSSTWERASWRLPTRLFSRFLRVCVSASPPNSAPIRMPTARARNTAISEVAW